MENQFVPYELAVKLKELGFDDNCIAGYRDYNGIKLMTRLPNNTFPIIDSLGYGKYCKQNDHVVKAPLWQQAFDWFRENHNLYIIIIPTINMYWTFKTMTVIEGMVEVPPYDHVDANDYSTYEEVREACLEKLIEIVENKNKRNGIHNTTTAGFGI